MTRHFLNDLDLSPEELDQVLNLAQWMRDHPYAVKALGGPQTAAVIFDKTSTRTRVSFSAGIAALGGNPLVINPGEAQLGHKESISDTARVLDRQVSLIVWRTYAQADLEEMAQHSRVPVINSLSDDYHPCQLLADLLTVREHKGKTAGLTLTYLGDGANNMAHSYLLACAIAGMHVRIGTPADHWPRADVVARAEALAAEHGGSVQVTDDPIAAVSGADVVATDTWVSMGMEAEADGRHGEGSPFAPFSVTGDLLRHAAADAIVLHCLPAYRGYEIAADVIDGPQSVVWDEAENRLHAQKALMAFLLEHADDR